MNEQDSLDKLLHEWKSPEPTEEMDDRVAHAWSTIQPPRRGFWRLRLSIPAPALLAAVLVVVALIFWLRRPAAPAPQTRGIVTQLDARGFEPLPNGEARIVSAREIPDEK